MPGKPDLAGQADGVLLRRPQRVGGNRFLDAEPVAARGAVPGPVQPRMIAEDLQSGADDEDQQEQVEEVLNPDPDRQSRMAYGVGRRDGARIAGDEVLHRRHVTQALGGRDRDDQDHESDRQQPQQVEPPALSDPDARRDAVRDRHRTGPRARVHHVLADGQLRPETRYHLRGDAGVRRGRQIGRRVGRFAPRMWEAFAAAAVVHGAAFGHQGSVWSKRSATRREQRRGRRRKMRRGPGFDECEFPAMRFR